MYRYYTFRLYPNKKQAERIEQTFGACRWIWNISLELKSAAYKVNGTNLTWMDLSNMIVRWKETNPWLKEVPSAALYATARELGKAYQSFYSRVKAGQTPGYPKFKSKRSSEQSFKVQCKDGFRLVDNKHVRLPKLGIIKARISRNIDGSLVSAVVKRTPSGKYMLIVLAKEASANGVGNEDLEILGIDVGVKDLLVCSNGTRFENPRILKASERKLRREHRKLSRKKKGSANWQKQRVAVARAYEHVANQRRDAIHKITTQVVSENQAIAVEDLDVSGMVKNHHLAKSISDASFYTIAKQLEYKCEQSGKGFYKVDRWFPSTRLCGCCGSVNKKLTLKDREWTCPECGAHYDRDLNAARNIAIEARKQIQS